MNKSSPSFRLLLGGAVLLMLGMSSAFQTPVPRSVVRRQTVARIPTTSTIDQSTTRTTTTTTQLSMYNLPPSGGGGGGDGGGGKDDGVVGQVLSGALFIGAVVLFFASPLGGIFFAITNSLLLLAIITPSLLAIAFQIWRKFNIVEGACPNCGAPCSVIKDVDQQSICFNCGQVLQIGSDLETIELPPRQGGSFIDMDQPGGMRGGGGDSIFDIFNDAFGMAEAFTGGENSSFEQPTKDEVKQKESKFRRESTIVDVEVSKDD